MIRFVLPAIELCWINGIGSVGAGSASGRSTAHSFPGRVLLRLSTLSRNEGKKRRNTETPIVFFPSFVLTNDLMSVEKGDYF